MQRFSLTNNVLDKVVIKVAYTVFARSLADAIQHAHKDCKNKHAIDTAII